VNNQRLADLAIGGATVLIAVAGLSQPAMWFLMLPLAVAWAIAGSGEEG
jgi:hypothetical protein